jgi:cell division protein ZapE
MSPKNADSARRFTWLVDVFYDDRVKLVVGAEAQPDDLFTGSEDAGGNTKTAIAEFARTASRLTEMQSAAYLQAERVKR